jgi:glycolate oxidase FAD binding subunit
MHSDGKAEQRDADVQIDGQTPAAVIAPETPQEAADLLAEAAAKGQAVAPVGGGTALGLGNVPERLDLALSTRHLTGIIDYEPTDMTLSIWAGSRFGDVQAVLAEHGQT